jgi:hypothetical protein
MNEILMIERVYRQAENGIENLSGLSAALKHWYQVYPEHNFLHPCVIEGKAALVCQRGLSLLESGAYAELAEIAASYGIFLKEDNRAADVGREFSNRRKNIGLVLSFCVGLLASSRIVTAAELLNPMTTGMASVQLASPGDAMQASIAAAQNGDKVIRLRQAKLPSAQEVIAAYAEKQSALKVNQQAEISIKNLLKLAYQPEAADPAYIVNDLAEIADYYAKYPQVIQLLAELQTHKLVLKYKAGNWQAQAWGNQYAVDSVTITFDTRVAAQLLNQADCQANPACDISPADALLHELLHAKLMLVESRHFIESGGMQPTLYNYEHEREVIANENQLYYQMNLQDGRSRPLRKEHAGRLFHVNCAACAPTELVSAN